MIEAKDRISNIFDLCFSYNNFDPNLFEITVLVFRPNENRDHIEFHIQVSALVGILDHDEARTYFVHLFPDRDHVTCQTDIVRIKENVDQAWYVKKWKQIKSKKAKDNFIAKCVEHISTFDTLLDSPIKSDFIDWKHIQEECKRRVVYFGHGDIP